MMDSAKNAKQIVKIVNFLQENTSVLNVFRNTQI